MSNDTFLFRVNWTAQREAEIINIGFFQIEKDCVNVGRLANTTLRHYSESSEHSRNSLGRRPTDTIQRLKTWLNMFDNCSLGVPTEIRK